MRLEDCVVSRVPGRIRLRVPALKGNDALLGQAQAWVQRFPGVNTVSVNPLTASMLVSYDPDREAELMASARQVLALLPVEDPGSGGPSPQEWLAAQAATMREAMTHAAPLAALALFGLGVLQVARGQVLAPAVSLFWYALSALSKSDPASRG